MATTSDVDLCFLPVAEATRRLHGRTLSPIELTDSSAAAEVPG